MNSIKSLVIKKLKKDITHDIYHDYIELIDIHEIKYIIDNTIQEYFDSYTINYENDNNSDNNHLFRDRDLYKIDELTCKARIWNEGYGGQCSRKYHTNSIHQLCKKHDLKFKENTLTLGFISEKKPKNPKNSKGINLQWKN